MSRNINELENELKQARDKIDSLTREKSALEKAIWDIMNYSSMFLLLLDKHMKIKLINWSLATKLGYQNEKEPINMCWLKFIKEEDQDMIKTIYASLSKDKRRFHREVTNDIISLNNTVTTVKWFNIPINSNYNMVLSFGIERIPHIDLDEESIRAYYSDIIQKDKTMIEALRISALSNNSQYNDFCKVEDTK